MASAWPQIAEIEQRLTIFQKKVFAAVLKSYEQMDNPLRLNNFATGMRELARIILDDLAPKGDIKACGWYAQQYNQQGQPVVTRAQRITYAVQAGLLDDFVKGTLLVDVKETINKFNGLIASLSKFTHVEQATFNTDATTADGLAKEALDIFILLFQTIDECRKQVQAEVEDHAIDAVDDELISATVQELDEIATHHQVYGSNIDDLEVIQMGPDTIKFKAIGSVDCQLQYGSDGDYGRGDGMRIDDSYPLTCDLMADITTPLELKVTSLRIDNSSFYE